MNEKDKDSGLFAQVIMMFATSAMQALGQMPRPGSQEVQQDLEAARYYIDMLDMLTRKTAGNLGEDEARMLKEAVASLKLAFVECSSGAPTAKESPAAPTGKPIGESTAAPAPEPPNKDSAAKPDDGTRKYHKSYG